ncbi:MAG: 4a-hydroxytetrahydrobiopterin dehydratase [Sphingobacteriaceae bacterium]|nr:4a-hydroxytetrahydrobiopterin dehydratase [Sphingobacteriaceae bacterium]
MSTRQLLTPEALEMLQLQLKDWKVSAKSLERKLNFVNFSEAWAFLNRVALLAEKLDHHPHWSNVYNQVEIQLSTHDRGGVTALDAQMAAAINEIL